MTTRKTSPRATRRSRVWPAALHLALPEIVVFGVQPALAGWSDQLSPPVHAAVEQVIEAIVGQASLLAYA
jgi:hypothetical protein